MALILFLTTLWSFALWQIYGIELHHCGMSGFITGIMEILDVPPLPPSCYVAPLYLHSHLGLWYQMNVRTAQVKHQTDITRFPIPSEFRFCTKAMIKLSSRVKSKHTISFWCWVEFFHDSFNAWWPKSPCKTPKFSVLFINFITIEQSISCCTEPPLTLYCIEF